MNIILVIKKDSAGHAGIITFVTSEKRKKRGNKFSDIEKDLRKKILR